MTKLTQPIRGAKGANIIGSRSPEIEPQNSDILLPP